MGARRPRYELVVAGADGASRTLVRFGRVRLALALLLACAAAAALLLVGVVALPSRLSTSLQAREMEVLVARRAQLGERLRSLADRFEQLELQAASNQERVERVRRLYGLPELAQPAGAARAPAPRVETIYSAALLHVAKLAQRVEERLAAADSLLASLASWERDHGEEATTVPARLPVRGVDAVPLVLFGQGEEAPGGDAGEFHSGLDLAAPAGSAVFAPAAGVVRWAGEAPPSAGASWWRLGRTIVVAHGSSYRTLFGHCDRLLVKVGQRVESGQPLATVGTSGQAASPRLHYEVRRRDALGVWQAVDPLSLLLDLERFERELGARLPSRGEVDAAAAPPLPSAFAR